MAISVTINGEQRDLNVDPDTPLLWVIRDHLQLTGTKFGCGIAQCGACTVHMNGTPIRSCSMPVSAVAGQQITTIEAVSGPEAEALQAAWEELAVYQCGYCQSGQLMSAVNLLKSKPTPSDTDIDQFMSGNICRCATYVRIRAGIKHAAAQLATEVTL
ncbi:MAG: (2Fe-2S)-binding protein [Zhongshania sp.]|uniref:(2Fe-2S)-binding protein n=1 Tax=Zhongshania sp. TaxID=1971902 RepID=UPI00263300A8|nr:(2Fe-2S)-binding protein [Zhongshania sp.]MDF1693722.1 (2Fe-2S)-binding protein [Zhongshania sp.]